MAFRVGALVECTFWYVVSTALQFYLAMQFASSCTRPVFVHLCNVFECMLKKVVDFIIFITLMQLIKLAIRI